MLAEIALPIALAAASPTPPCSSVHAVREVLDELIDTHSRRLPPWGGAARRLEELLASPRDAVCELVMGLHPVRVRSISGYEPPPDKEALRVVWRIRALRYLTGCLDMKAPTKESPSHPVEQGRYFLELKGRERLPFFAVWMSRDATYLAPVDTQASIAKQWRTWFAENGDGFRYQACEALNDWYF